MTGALTDTHAHLSYVVERLGPAALDGISAAYGAAGRPGDGGGSGDDSWRPFILDPGVDYDDFPGRKAAFGGLPFARLAAGIWPDAESMPARAREERLAVLATHARDPACVAVGECGLDYHWMNGTEEEQAALFAAQAELAASLGKPLIVHSREAHADTLAIVRTTAERVPVVIHCFGYDEAACRDYLAAGCYVSFAGNLTYKKSSDLRAACAIVPADRLLLETDAPYMCPEPRRGRDSTPLDIARTYALAAELRGTGVAELARAVTENALAIFTE